MNEKVQIVQAIYRHHPKVTMWGNIVPFAMEEFANVPILAKYGFRKI